ncbi:MAG: MarR family winged helix-turn-helix transcriptional regulator [Pygmaiobacter sp.]|nr:MarR family winged helix-turn-helix transcriptional regulator [Pygmaiobacter sp.]
MHTPHPEMGPFKNETDPRVRELFQAAGEIRDLFVNYSPLPELSQGQFVLMRHLYVFETHGCAMPHLPPGAYDAQEHGLKITALAGLMRNAPPTISQKVDELEALGYIQRRRGKRDRRAVYVSLTDEGRTLVKEAVRLYDHLGRKVVNRLGEEQINTFIATLHDLKTAITAEQDHFSADFARRFAALKESKL